MEYKQQTAELRLMFRVLTGVSTKMAVFRDFAFCSLVETDRRPRAAYWHHHQGDWKKRIKTILTSTFLFNTKKDVISLWSRTGCETLGPHAVTRYALELLTVARLYSGRVVAGRVVAVNPAFDHAQQAPILCILSATKMHTSIKPDLSLFSGKWLAAPTVQNGTLHLFYSLLHSPCPHKSGDLLHIAWYRKW